MKQYLGLDVSPLRIGAALWEANDSECALLWSETHTFDPKDWITPGMRAEVIEALHERRECEPDLVAMEAVFVGPNKLGAIRAAMALGQVESICDYEWEDARQKILTATQWRSLCSIPQGGKTPVMGWATRAAQEHGVDAPADQDAADAICIAYAAWKWDLDHGAE